MKNDVADGRSFMKIRNSNGPRIDPWGTPNKILIIVDFTLS